MCEETASAVHGGCAAESHKVTEGNMAGTELTSVFTFCGSAASGTTA